MYCRWCGMESKTTDVCEWCKKPLTPPPPAPPAPPPPMDVPFPAAAMPSAAVTPQMVQEQLRQEETPLGERWEKFLAMAMPLLTASVLLIHFVPAAFLWVAFADLFIVSAAMGATGAIEPYEEAFADCFVVLLVCFLLGPIVALGVYFLVGLVKQEWNAAIILLLIGHLVVRLVLAIAFTTSAAPLSLVPQFSMIPGADFFAVVCSFAGWMMSSFFRPLNR